MPLIEESPIYICKAKSQGDILLSLSSSYSLHRVPQTKPAFPGMRMTGENPVIDLILFRCLLSFCKESSVTVGVFPFRRGVLIEG